MWMLVRANALGAETRPEQRTRTLAACPDTGDRGEPWRWTVTLDESAPEPGIAVEADQELIRVFTEQFRNGHIGVLHRSAGDQLIIAALAGETLVAAVHGPWERWLRPGDVFILEGEDAESVRVSLAAGESYVEVVSLAPRKAHALRWVP